MTIVDFLLARIDEDRAEILAAAVDADPSTPYGVHWSEVKFASCSPGRVLAELEAKRRVVEQVSDVAWGTYAVREVVCGLLAAPYSGHPDFDPAWSVGQEGQA